MADACALRGLSSCISDLFSIQVKVKLELSPLPLMAANVTTTLLPLSYRENPHINTHVDPFILDCCRWLL